MKLSPHLIGTFCIGSLFGLMLGAVVWRLPDIALKKQSENQRLLVTSASNAPKPAEHALPHTVDGATLASKSERIAQARDAFLALGKIGSSNWSSITGGPAFTKAMMGLSGFTSSDYAALFAELSSGGLNDEAMVAPLLAWGSMDAEAALEFAMGDKDLRTKEKILAMIVHQFAKTNPTAARIAVEKMEKNEKAKCQMAIVAALFETDRTAAVRWADEFGDPKTTAKLFQNWAEEDIAGATLAFGAGHPGQEGIAWELARSVLAKDPAGFKTWADGLHGTVASAANARVVLSLIETDPASGARALEHILTADPSADKFCSIVNLAPSVVSQWWKSGQPQEIAAWASSLTGEVQTQAVRDVAKAWVGKNSADASVWIKTLPNGSARDAAVGQLINSIRDEFPTDALEWAQSISNSEQQAAALNSIKFPSIAK